MANLVITVTSIRLSTDCKSAIHHVKAGGILVAGEFAYKTSAGLYLRGQSDGTAAEAEAIAFCLTGAGASGQYVAVLEGKCTFNPGAALTQGETYILSHTSGKFAPVADWIAARYKTHAAIAIDANTWEFDPQPSGVTG
jgi:hypothetical protein